MSAPSPYAVAHIAGASLSDSAANAVEHRSDFFRERSCERKWRYDTIKECSDAARRILDNGATGGVDEFAVYDCQFCNGFHMTSDVAQTPGKVALVRASNFRKPGKGKRAKNAENLHAQKETPRVASADEAAAFFAAHAQNMGRRG